jgi:BRCT domain type II-containing protein
VREDERSVGEDERSVREDERRERRKERSVREDERREKGKSGVEIDEHYWPMSSGVRPPVPREDNALPNK